MEILRIGSTGTIKITLTEIEATQFAGSAYARAAVGESVRLLFVDETAKATPVQIAVMQFALNALDKCRDKCPGMGVDVDADNLRFLIAKGGFSPSTLLQSAKTLEHLSKGLEINAKTEIDALREVAS